MNPVECEIQNPLKGKNVHTINIETLRNEALRQLNLLQDLLKEAQQKGLIEKSAAQKGTRATLDSESILEVQQVLEGERHKLNHLDMVLAVVGTMKAAT